MADPVIPLHHALATLAYRAETVFRGIPPRFGKTNFGEGTRSAAEILSHVGDVLAWGLSMVRGQQKWETTEVMKWTAEVERFRAVLGELGAALASGESQADSLRLFQGPIADALTHVGQLSILRRLAGAPVERENFYLAEIGS